MLHLSPKSSERDNALRQNDYERECWDTLLEARDETASEKARRENLLELNRLLGDVNYKRGQMP